MDESFTLFSFMSLLFLSTMMPTPLTSAFKSTHLPLCHDDERSVLFQFKETFIIDKDRASSDDPSAYSKLESWKLDGDCCSWDGVECDHLTGHVIGLDLSSSCLYGSINSSSSLFRLIHLRKLNLASNDFNYSQIPSAICLLSNLVSLNMSNSFLSGPTPSNISILSSLSSLDLSLNDQLSFQASDFTHLVNNLTPRLEVLSLSGVNLSSTVPAILANASSLSYLALRNCGLYGEFPVEIFHLPKLKVLNLNLNENLRGHLPDFYSTSPLRILRVASTSFSGEIPGSIGNLDSLTHLDLSDSNFSGKLKSISQLRNLEMLSLARNSFSGTVELNIFLKLEKLEDINLSENNLTLLTNTSSNNTFQKFRDVGFAHCNLDEFPGFLRYQDKLESLELSMNNIAGQIPKWLWNMSTDTLQFITLASNFLTGFEAQPNPIVFPWIKALVIDLSDNMLQSSLPLPPASIESYYVSYNKLIGEIPQSFCNLTSLYGLSMDNNQLSGRLPSCLGNFSTHMEFLNLGRNDFYGKIPLTFSTGSNWRMIELSYNRLRGEVPRSLSNCAMLEFLDIGNNQIRDVFPSWLGSLPNLKVLILRSNQFHGVLTGSTTVLEFQKLRIIDLSKNNFTGQLPTQYFCNWVAMKALDEDQLTYIDYKRSFGKSIFVTNFYTMLITSKGTERGYEQILENFVVVDLSCNRFEGNIPEVVGSLQGLRLLNLSHNDLNGDIPSTLANLTYLESLDLSQNKLSGMIPQQLVQLNSLAVFNVSHNLLTGPIPRGKQFNTFQNDSYQENLGLCENPLSRKCGSSEAPPILPAILDGKHDSNSLGFGWECVVPGDS